MIMSVTNISCTHSFNLKALYEGFHHPPLELVVHTQHELLQFRRKPFTTKRLCMDRLMLAVRFSWFTTPLVRKEWHCLRLTPLLRGHYSQHWRMASGCLENTQCCLRFPCARLILAPRARQCCLRF